MNTEIDHGLNSDKNFSVGTALSDLIEESPYAAHLTDAQTGQFILSNTYWTQILGMKSKDIAGLTQADLFYPNATSDSKWDFGDRFIQWRNGTVERVQKRVEEVIKLKRPTRKIHFLFTYEGYILLENLIKIPIFDREQKKVIAIVSYNEDVTLERSLPELFQIYRENHAGLKAVQYLLMYLDIDGYFEEQPTLEETQTLLILHENGGLLNEKNNENIRRIQEKMDARNWHEMATQLCAIPRTGHPEPISWATF